MSFTAIAIGPFPFFIQTDLAVWQNFRGGIANTRTDVSIFINMMIADFHHTICIDEANQMSKKYAAATIGCRHQKAILLILKNSFFADVGIIGMTYRTKSFLVVINHG